MSNGGWDDKPTVRVDATEYAELLSRLATLRAENERMRKALEMIAERGAQLDGNQTPRGRKGEGVKKKFRIGQKLEMRTSGERIHAGTIVEVKQLDPSPGNGTTLIYIECVIRRWVPIENVQESPK